MTRIDFYLMQDAATERAKELAACKLARKAYILGHRIYILTGDEEGARRLDHLLWTFSAGSFIPHGLNLEQAPGPAPVLIGHQDPPEDSHEVLISLAAQISSGFNRFERVADIVGSSEDEKRQGRDRYRFYRDRGYSLQTHNL